MTLLPDPQPKFAVAMIETIPMPLCWTLVAVSAGILILQIWNYVS